MPSLLIHRGPNVYDVSPFLSSHPGGSDCILALANTDISLAMTQEGGGHEHSEAAWEMMEAFRVWVDPGTLRSPHFGREEGKGKERKGKQGRPTLGVLTSSVGLGCSEWEAPENFVPEDTDTSLDFKRSNFLDLSQPLLGQLWRADRIRSVSSLPYLSEYSLFLVRSWLTLSPVQYTAKRSTSHRSINPVTSLIPPVSSTLPCSRYTTAPYSSLYSWLGR
jgi:hypothetical protein